jgi:alkylhydroperoxidase family enzyme
MTDTSETDLRQTVAVLAHRVAVLEAQQEIRRLHHAYGYYLDKCHYSEVAALFSDEELSHLGFAIAMIYAWNRLNVAFGRHADG